MNARNKVWKLLVIIAFTKYVTAHGLRTPYSPETPTQSGNLKVSVRSHTGVKYVFVTIKWILNLLSCFRPLSFENFPVCVTDEIYKSLVLNMNRQISNWRTPKRDLSTNTKEKLFLEVILSMPWCHERRGLYWAGGSLADISSLAKSLVSKTPVPAAGRTGNDGLGSCTDIYRGKTDPGYWFNKLSYLSS